MYLRCPPKVSSIIEQPTLDAGGWWTSPASRGGGDFWTFFSLLDSDYPLTLWGLYKSLSELRKRKRGTEKVDTKKPCPTESVPTPTTQMTSQQKYQRRQAQALGPIL